MRHVVLMEATGQLEAVCLLLLPPECTCEREATRGATLVLFFRAIRASAKTKVPLVGRRRPRSRLNTPARPSKSIKRSSSKIICSHSEPVWPKGSGGAKSRLCCPGTQRPLVLRPVLARSARLGFQLRLCSPSAAIMKPRCKTESTEAPEQRRRARTEGRRVESGAASGGRLRPGPSAAGGLPPARGPARRSTLSTRRSPKGPRGRGRLGEPPFHPAGWSGWRPLVSRRG